MINLIAILSEITLALAVLTIWILYLINTSLNA